MTIIDTPAKALTADQLLAHMQASLGEAVTESRTAVRAEGVKKGPAGQVWLVIDRSALVGAIQTLADLHIPHLTVISGADRGEYVELNYHMGVFYGPPGGQEIMVTITVRLPKDDLTVDTITGILPGALTSEREKQEFFGITVNNIPDDRRMFLPDAFPKDVFPWRRDDAGVPEHMIKKLWAVGREAGCGTEECCVNDIPEVQFRKRQEDQQAGLAQIKQQTTPPTPQAADEQSESGGRRSQGTTPPPKPTDTQGADHGQPNE